VAEKEEREGRWVIVTIDGSQGEGGGQILRTALSLSMATGKPLTLENIRAGRAKPGLMRQHLACVRAAVAISGSKADGAEIGSKRLVFHPGEVTPGQHRFDIGSAGSTMLVLQTVLPVLVRCDQPSIVTVTGGTHNLAAPSFDMVMKVWLPLLKRMGQNARATCVQRGFYPAGGGEVWVEIEPAQAPKPLILEDRGALVSTELLALVANLPFDIARREAEAVAHALEWPAEICLARTDAKAQGPGNVVMATVGHEQVTEVFTAHGRHGVSAEQVGKELAREVREYLTAGAPVGPHLADQLLLPMALGAGGRFVTSELTEHSRTSIGTIRAFLDASVDVIRLDDARWRIIVDAQI
jgi:RNA 3'-terminal phosphate cyclase (ATP)